MSDELERLTWVFIQAFERLNVSISLQEVGELAQTVYDAMTGYRRSYHNLEHIYGFVDPADPVRNLAALYHDVVYYQVDRGMIPAIRDLITPEIRQEGDVFSIAPQFDPQDKLFCLALKIFDLKPGDVLTLYENLNEFLSAVVMIRTLGKFVPVYIILQLLVFIEATIPFRNRNARGQTPFEAMEERLSSLPAHFCAVALSPAEIDSVIKAAVVFANKDIANFAEEDPASFLANTWKLLPETNLELGERRAYTIRNYLRALEKTEYFLNHLEPEQVFNRYDDVPAPEEFHRMTERARFNINMAIQYLRVRLVTISLIDALAQVTGGDVPLVTFMGGSPRSTPNGERIEDYLPQVVPPPWEKENPVLYGLLGNGRNSSDNFDVHNSPISFYVYNFLPPEEQLQAYMLIKTYTSGEISAADFLSKLDRTLVSNIARAAAKMLPKRADALSRWVM